MGSVILRTCSDVLATLLRDTATAAVAITSMSLGNTLGLCLAFTPVVYIYTL